MIRRTSWRDLQLHAQLTTATSIMIPENKPSTYTPRCTSDEYVKAIAHHSRQSSAESLYPGEIYDTLKRFLEQRSTTISSFEEHDTPDFAWLVCPDQPVQQASTEKHLLSDNNKNRSRSESFSNPESCLKALRGNIEAFQPQVLFLRGHPSPSWLSSIGAFCSVDPELFRWFLRYREAPGIGNYFGSAPSMMSNIYRFKFFTIGSKNNLYRSTQDEIDAMRDKASNDLQTYQTDLRGNWALNIGDSIVRNFHVLDGRHCVIEQEIVTSIFEVGKTWMGRFYQTQPGFASMLIGVAIACSDAGYDLTHGPPFPWLNDGAKPLPVKLLPIFQYRPRCALKSRGINESTNGSNYRRGTQSLAVFPEGFGRRGLSWLNSNHLNVFLDMFRLSAFSQKQLLNVLQEKVKIETTPRTLSNDNPTLANLLYFREILQDQMNNASYMLELASDRGRLRDGRRSSTKIPTDQRNFNDYASAEVCSLYKDICSQAQSLHEICTQGMIVISNNSMLEESQRAIQQARLVTKLTLVAFVYLPFTFTAGFFGMNFQELGTGTLPLWTFFAASFPLMVISMLFFALDLETVKKTLRLLRPSN